MCNQTQLLLDQTKLQSGQLPALGDTTMSSMHSTSPLAAELSHPAGVANMNAITKMVVHQKLDYDFQFYQSTFDVDVRTLVLSDGKGLFPVPPLPACCDGIRYLCGMTEPPSVQADCHVFLQPEGQPGTLQLDAAQLAAVRAYLIAAPDVEYAVPDAMAKVGA